MAISLDEFTLDGLSQMVKRQFLQAQRSHQSLNFNARMKDKLLLLIWSAALAFICIVVGVLALLDYPNAEIYFWTRSAVESKTGKLAWIIVSALCSLTFVAWAVREYRKKKPGPPSDS